MLVGGLTFAEGGYFPTSWGWSALALLWVVAAMLLVRADVRLAALERATLGALAALGGWTALSITWSGSVAQSVLEIERAIVFLAALAAAVFVAGRRTVPALLGGTLVAITLASAYGLGTRLFPERMGVYDPLAVYRLSEPVGYWNGLAILAALGVLLAVAFALRSSGGARCALAAASLLVLVPALYFTFSRGGWIALGLGLVAALALDPRRLQLVTGLFVLAPAPLFAVWLGSRSPALTRQQSTLEEASRDGHRLALAIVALAGVAALAALAFRFAAGRVTVGRGLRLAYAACLALLVAGVLTATFVRFGSPPTLAAKAYEAFKAPPAATGADLNRRLFSLSGNGRADMWAAAWDTYAAHPLLGSGAGTYEQHWNRERPSMQEARDAHNLYLETLAELGPVGLALLVAALGIPVVAAVRARRHPLAAAAFGAYAAYLAHAGVDWDWELTGVTVAALLCASALLLAARRNGDARALGNLARAGGVATALALAAFAFVGLLGNGALAAGYEAFAAGRDDQAEDEAAKAARWAPWSPQPWHLRGELELAQGRKAEARSSFETAIAKDEMNWELWFALARASDGDARRRAFERALALNPKSGELLEFQRLELGAAAGAGGVP